MIGTVLCPMLSDNGAQHRTEAGASCLRHSSVALHLHVAAVASSQGSSTAFESLSPDGWALVVGPGGWALIEFTVF